MAIPVVLGADDVSVEIRIIDSTDGTPETGVTSASAGLALSYRKGSTGALTAITESDLSALTDAHSDGGMKHVNAGSYRVDLPDAAIPTAENEVTWVTGVVTGMIVIPAALVGRATPAVAGDAMDLVADALDAAALKADAVTEIQAGLAVPGDAMTLTAGERTSIGTAVWASATRTLSSYGTLVADVWDRLTSALTTSGSIGALILARLNSAGFTIFRRGILGGGSLEIVQGDTYLAADDSEQSWTFESPYDFSLSGKTGRLGAVNNAGETWTIGATFAQTGTTVTVTLADISAAVSAELTEGSDWRWQLKADLTGGPVTVQRGGLAVTEDLA